MNTHALNNIYNFYLTTYSKDCSSPFDSHKKSELRSVYNSMVKLNKESPVYLLKNTQSVQAYAVGIKENARLLRNNIASLGGVDEATLLNKKAAYSSDESKITANFVGEHTATEDIPSFEIEVGNLATGQTNLGDYLPSNTKTFLRPKTYSFDLHINDMNYEFQFSIGESETNLQVQERLCKLINNSNVGLESQILHDDNGNTALQISSVSTGIIDGKDTLFHITDYKTSQAAGSVSYFGLNKIKTPASNAHFTINGTPHSSYSNNFMVEKTYELHLKDATNPDEPITIGTKNDVESLVGNISHMVQGYNDFIKSISEYRDEHPMSSRLLNEVSGIANYYSDTFSSLGLSLDEDGILSINSDAMKTSLESEDMENLFSDMKNFTSSLLKKSNEVTLDPMKYVDKKVVAYKNPGKTFSSPYTSSIYSGMMFNYYC
ncbi:MAG: flagellar filament capping protein FliD [Lachnospiraceae bacterium]|nr:flagellar filament capping protein FliD [Lachnospiraceae bacterium]